MFFAFLGCLRAFKNIRYKIRNTKNSMKSQQVQSAKPFLDGTTYCLYYVFTCSDPRMEVNLGYVKIYFDTPTFDRITKHSIVRSSRSL